MNPESRTPETPEDKVPSKDAYVLQKGEGLFSIARKLKVGNHHPAQIAAAIWMKNINKFIFNSIHGIQEGVQLDLKNLEEHVSGIDLQTARSILKNQAVEWKLAKSATRAEVKVSTIPEIPLPSERLEDLADLSQSGSNIEKKPFGGHIRQRFPIPMRYRSEKSRFCKRRECYWSLCGNPGSRVCCWFPIMSRTGSIFAW